MEYRIIDPEDPKFCDWECCHPDCVKARKEYVAKCLRDKKKGK